MQHLKADEMRNMVFGIEDSLVSTFGVLFGITAIAGISKAQIIATGFITIVVEATSMGAGTFLSESTADEVEGTHKFNPLKNGVIMFFSYLLAGFVPLGPYVFFETDLARLVSVIASALTLFLLGFLPRKSTRSGFKMALVAGVAATLGFIVAHVFSV